MSCARCFQPQQLFTIDAILASDCKSEKIPDKELRHRHLELCTSMHNELPINPDVSLRLHSVGSYWSQQISKSLPMDLDVKDAGSLKILRQPTTCFALLEPKLRKIQRNTLICKQIWFCGRLTWSPAESLVYVFKLGDCADLMSPKKGETGLTPPTSPADIGSYDKGDFPPRLHTLKSVKSRSPRIPFTKIQVDVLEAKFQQTHYLSGMEVYQLSSKLSLGENRLSEENQLDYLSLRVSVNPMSNLKPNCTIYTHPYTNLISMRDSPGTQINLLFVILLSN
ncbi:hypothetical protein CSKR_100621 [Clonorchis sinensis]|uniref:Uncharacterized protein n=1 Tax=Clonorchis sinensis TaxID=79923 RepID=A0A3R7D5E9_CLOSI|nr:hypothetical protein CSKR_100621 [Clonorchis sinensis]